MLKINSKNLDQWLPQHQDAIARLLWVNWIWQRLSIEPIRKPILVHVEHNDFVVDCGDTRLMALSLLSDDSKVSVVCTSKKELDSMFQAWARVRNNQDLIDATGFGPTAGIFLTPSDHNSHALSWLEIGDSTTSHHLHNVDLRVRMMQGYLDQQTKDFEFSEQWCKSLIDWNSYAN
jgi:hypothetical protein